jgi:hypothetical protein
MVDSRYYPAGLQRLKPGPVKYGPSSPNIGLTLLGWTTEQLQVVTKGHFRSSENLVGTDTGRVFPTEIRLGVGDYNDLTYSTLVAIRNDSDSQTVRRHHDSDLASRVVVFRDCTDFSTRVHQPRDFTY